MHVDMLRKLYENHLRESMELVWEEYRKTERYKELLKKEKELYEGLKERLPCDLKAMLVSYTDVLYYIMIEQREFYFRQGVSDSCQCSLKGGNHLAQISSFGSSFLACPYFMSHRG